MTTTDTNRYACPQCGGEMLYDAQTTGLKCQYCNFQQSLQAAQGAQTGLANAPREIPLAEGMSRAVRGLGTPVTTFECKECGARVNVPPNEQTAACTYCASNFVVAIPEDPSLIRPESLIAFSIEKKTASDSFRTWLKGLWFRPSNLHKMAQLDQIIGVYVPYWTFDAAAQSQWSAERGHYYYTEEQYTENENGKQVVRTRRVQHTRWEPARGHRNDRYDDMLVCGSKGLPREHADRFATFATNKLVPYDPRYLAGWRAESYAVDLMAAWPLAEGRMRATQEQRCGGDVGGDTHRSLSVNTQLGQQTFKHVLLPVWIAAYRYNGKPFRFLVNGQTGEVVGEAPWSWVKITLAVLFVLAIVVTIVVLGQQQ